MIKHYDCFIGGHDSTVNHRRKRAMAREAMRDSLTTRCHSRTPDRPDRLDADHLPVEILFFPSFFLISGRERDGFHDIHDIRARGRFERVHARASSHAFRSSPVIAGQIEASATGNEAIPDTTTYVRGRVIRLVVVTIAYLARSGLLYIGVYSDESNYLTPQIISMALLMLRTSFSIGSVGSIGCSGRASGMRGIHDEDKHRRLVESCY